VASGDQWKTGAPRRGVITRAFTAPVEQRARYAFGDAPHVVDTSGCGTPTKLMAPAIVLPGANGSRGWIGVIVAEPPPSAAGLVQSTCLPASAVRPKRAFAGGFSPNVEKAMTQPIWERERQAGTRLKSPPTSLPFFTSTLPPSSTAEINRRRTRGLGSISFGTRGRSTNVPCEWPISTTPRPWL